MIYISILFKAFRKVINYLVSIVYTPLAKTKLFLNGADVNKGLRVKGTLKVFVTRRGTLTIGTNCRINSGLNHNVSGGNQKNIFWVEGNLKVGDNVGMSSSAILCRHSITIGNNVTIGGNTLIIDTDSHALDPKIRKNKELDLKSAKWGNIIISDNVFIGARSTILKGVTIGRNSIIGACSVVTKDIPENEVWAGNPACCLKQLKY